MHDSIVPSSVKQLGFSHTIYEFHIYPHDVKTMLFCQDVCTVCSYCKIKKNKEKRRKKQSKNQEKSAQFIELFPHFLSV